MPVFNDCESVQLLAAIDETSTSHSIILEPPLLVVLVFPCPPEEENVLWAPDNQDLVSEHEHVTQIIVRNSCELEAWGVLSVDSDSSTLSVEAVHPLFAIIEASLREVLFGAVLVIVCLQSSSSPPIDVVDEVVVHVSSLLLDVVVWEKHSFLVKEAANGERIEKSSERQRDVW